MSNRSRDAKNIASEMSGKSARRTKKRKIMIAPLRSQHQTISASWGLGPSAAMASEAEIKEYLDEMKGHFQYYASAQKARLEMGIPGTAANRTHADDLTWKAIKKSVKAILKPYNLEGRQPTIEEQLTIANEIEKSQPLKDLCDANGQSPRYFVSWLIHSVVRNQNIVRKRKEMRQTSPGGEIGDSIYELDAEASSTTLDDTTPSSEPASGKGFSIQNLLN
ncbi:hypothetical protein Dda_6982 [Drechslerella dactyloides]|uniref:Uncharacterized protein n=1 Tax=Drechslerella dactyloides TaxID=74499 RepID=A0AAD6NH49_DREDA|nr:hypothetical protein Dda_6982 [Drechslerella dactyloides]